MGAAVHMKYIRSHTHTLRCTHLCIYIFFLPDRQFHIRIDSKNSFVLSESCLSSTALLSN